MERPCPSDSAAGPARTWAVHRQDDNGNRFVVQGGLSRAVRLARGYRSGCPWRAFPR